MAQRRQWRIAVDGATTSFGTAQAPADGGAACFRVRVSSWAALAPATRGLRDPCEALGAQLIARVFAALSVRERLRCAAVCRSWRAELAPPLPGHASVAWARLNLSAPAFWRDDHAEPMDALLTRVVLPRYGHAIRKLSLRGSDVTDAGLQAVARSCPALRCLDVRDCADALHYKHDDEHDENEQYPFLRLMRHLYARAPSGTRFKLLLGDSGVHECADCGEYCEEAERVATETLSAVLAWPLKKAAGAPGAHTWLQTDLAPCPLREDGEDGFDCDVFMHRGAAWLQQGRHERRLWHLRSTDVPGTLPAGYAPSAHAQSADLLRSPWLTC